MKSKIIQYLEDCVPNSRLVEHSQSLLNFTCLNPEYQIGQPPVIWTENEGRGPSNVESYLQVGNLQIKFHHTVTEAIEMIKRQG